MRTYRRATVLVLVLVLLVSARAEAREAALLLEEPFGRFGAMTPTGHAAVYLSDVCAQSPTKLRACMPGENGVVLSRYHHVGGYDWLAIPLIPYLYAVDDASQIPSRADLGLETRLRNRYRREHLMDLVPDDPNEEIPRGEWIQLIGSAYDRRIFGYAIETSEEQDQALISDFNERRNKAHFNFFFNNCANFTANVMNYYYPHSIRRNFIADAGLMTPKHAAKSLVRFEKKHPEIENASFMIEQVPGIIPRSTPVDGLAEALLKSKKYVLPITLAQPFATVGLAVVYFGGGGRFHPDPHVTIFDATRQAVPGISSEPKPASPGAASTLAGFAGDESSGTELGTHSASLRAQ